MKILLNFDNFINENKIENNTEIISETKNSEAYTIVGDNGDGKKPYDSSNDLNEAQYLLSNFIEAFDENYKFWIEDIDGNKINIEPSDINDADIITNENKLNETGEWDKNINWQYVKDNPIDIEKNEFAIQIQYMEDLCNQINDMLPEGFPFEIKDIRGFDIYQGAYAIVSINNNNYKIWGTEKEDEVWIEHYKFDNTSDDVNASGLKGYPDFVADKIVETEIL